MGFSSPWSLQAELRVGAISSSMKLICDQIIRFGFDGNDVFLLAVKQLCSELQLWTDALSSVASFFAGMYSHRSPAQLSTFRVLKRNHVLANEDMCLLKLEKSEPAKQSPFGTFSMQCFEDGRLIVSKAFHLTSVECHSALIFGSTTNDSPYLSQHSKIHATSSADEMLWYQASPLICCMKC